MEKLLWTKWDWTVWEWHHAPWLFIAVPALLAAAYLIHKIKER